MSKNKIEVVCETALPEDQEIYTLEFVLDGKKQMHHFLTLEELTKFYERQKQAITHYRNG